MPNYEKFLKATNRTLPFIMIILQSLLNLTKYYAKDSKKYIDATPLQVYKNRRISRNKVCKGIAV
jgi:hypothetical protein